MTAGVAIVLMRPDGADHVFFSWRREDRESKLTSEEVNRHTLHNLQVVLLTCYSVCLHCQTWKLCMCQLIT